MKAIQIHQCGSPEVLKLEEVERPTPQDHEVLIRIGAASVNPVDCQIRSGAMADFISGDFPICLGYDLAGEVVECGQNAGRFALGDAVFALSNLPFGGAYAEYLALDETFVAHIPERFSFEQAAAVPGAGLTALQSLRNLGNLRPGLRVMIIGGSGGVGTFAIQMAKIWKCHVTAVTGTQNTGLAAQVGADAVLDYSRDSLHDIPDRFDILLDTIGEESFESVHHLLTPKGCYITTKQGPDMDPSRTRELSGFEKEQKIVRVKADAQDLKDLADLIQRKGLSPVIDRVVDWTEVVEAHRYSETRRARGKIVLKQP